MSTKDLEIKKLKEREENSNTLRRELAGLKGEVSHLKELLNKREQVIHEIKEEACQRSIEQTEVEEQHKIHLKTLNEKLKTLSDTVKKNKEVLMNQNHIESKLKEEINKGHSENKRLVEIITDLEMKEMASCRNVNDLVSQVRSREEEMENKDEEIEKIIEKLNKEREMVKILQESIEQARDENTKVKNKMKEFRENDTGDTQFKHFYENDFVNFKKYVSDQFNKLKVSISSVEKDKMEKYQPNPILKPTNGSRIAIDLDSGEIEEVEIDDSKKPRQNIAKRAKGKRTMLFSTSITRNIDMKELNDGLYEGSVELQMFKGKKAGHIKNYIKSHLELERPEECVIHMGGNDLPPGPNRIPVPVEEIAGHIIEAGETCKRFGAKKVFIAGVTGRPRLQRRCYALNDILEEKCSEHGFIYINNDNISISHLEDGVHLGQHGKSILTSNYLSALNSS